MNQTREKGTIVVFRIQLLAPSETFIVAQAAAMRRVSPFFVGWRRTARIELPEDASWTVDGGSLAGGCASSAERLENVFAQLLEGR
jgi:hypothetical protein